MLTDCVMQMLCFNVFWILILTVWGLIGIHTDKFGFKHVWEIWYASYAIKSSSDALYLGFIRPITA